MGLERGPLSLVSTTEELSERKSSDSGLEIRVYDCSLSAKVGTSFAGKRWSLADSGQGFFFFSFSAQFAH
jgi:hypothetical protein